MGAFTAGAMTSDNGVDAVHLLEKASGAQVKFVHVVRNPFDNIATMTLQHRQIKGRDGTHETKVSCTGFGSNLSPFNKNKMKKEKKKEK